MAVVVSHTLTLVKNLESVVTQRCGALGRSKRYPRYQVSGSVRKEGHTHTRNAAGTQEFFFAEYKKCNY